MPQPYRRKRHSTIRFLNAVEHEVPAGKTVHAILENYATHKYPKVIDWLGRYPDWTFYFTPTSASCLNAVEGFFAILTRRCLKGGVFKGVVDLQAVINCFVADHNQQSKPFVWTADPDKIIAAPHAGTKCWSQSANVRHGSAAVRAECPLSGKQPTGKFDPSATFRTSANGQDHAAL